MYKNNKRVALKDIVASQLPEFVRAQYPTFVSFVEAYYEYLDQQNIDLTKLKDIDETLDEFIKYFKAELAHNYPISSSVDTERYLLKHIRDQYLAKGSEASYKLLFRLLFGKDVYMDYPGKQMLRVSDGRWQQDVSIFVRPDLGDPYSLIGKTVDVQTSKKIYRTEVVPNTQKLTKITANIENVLKFNDYVYELFLDRNFYGQIQAGDVIKYGSEFQGQILPCTSKIKIQNKGIGFKPGQVFQVSSGEGTPIWFKVLTTESDGGLKTIDLIKFGLQYNTDFSLTILPTSAVSTRKKITQAPVAITYSLTEGVVGLIDVVSGGFGYTQVPDVVVGGNGSGATAHAVLEDGVVTQIIVDTQGIGYTNAFANVIAKPGDTGSGATTETSIGSIYEYTYSDKTSGFNESGYLNYGDYWASSYSDGAYVGTIIRQFFVDAKDTISGNPALLNVSLDALAKYPGYYKTNDGFLDDSMFIQDSYYYQAFSYVIRIDKQLETYASVVRTMLHPSGMAMFGEYSINNNIALQVALDSLVKSLGISLYDIVPTLDDAYHVFDIRKDLADELTTPVDAIQRFFIIKAPADETVTMTDPSIYFGKSIIKTFGLTGTAENVFLSEDGSVKTVTKVFDTDTTSLVETSLTRVFTKNATETVSGSEEVLLTVGLNKTDTISTPTNEGWIVKNPYDEGSYFAELYANAYDATITT